MIRRARPGDAHAIARVHVRTWQGAYAHVFPGDELAKLSVDRRVRLWDDYLPRDDVGIFVSESDESVTGFASVGPSRDPEGGGELYGIYVEPEHWGAGAGRGLIEAGEAWLRTHGYDRATLWVLDDNPRARRFYEAAGWRPDGTDRVGEHLGVRTREVRYRKRLRHGRRIRAAIRPASEADARALAEVHVRSWQRGYAHVFPRDRLAALAVDDRTQQWLNHLADARARTFAADADGTIAGFITVGASRDEDDAGEVWGIYVDPERWGSGIGRMLMEFAVKLLRDAGYDRATLWVLDDNPRARRFYEAGGWSLDGNERVGRHLGVETREVRYVKHLDDSQSPESGSPP